VFNDTTGVPARAGTDALHLLQFSAAGKGVILRCEKVIVASLAVAGMLCLSSCGKFFVSGSSVVSMTLSPANPAIQPGKTQQFKATGTLGDGSSQDVTSQAAWTSSSASTATVNSSGLATAVAVGTTTITATITPSSGSSTTSTVTANTTLTVSSTVPTSITIAPANASIRSGQTQQYTATATYSDNSTKDVTTSTTWSSNSTAVATISSSGLATAVSTGSTTISASFSGLSVSTSLTVTAF
jgi:uncharacterized protein YjdB